MNRTHKGVRKRELFSRGGECFNATLCLLLPYTEELEAVYVFL